jgi:hypothetical protein
VETRGPSPVSISHSRHLHTGIEKEEICLSKGTTDISVSIENMSILTILVNLNRIEK